MPNRSIYDVRTGRIDRQVHASPRQIERQTGDDEAHVDGHHDPDLYWVDKGVVKPRPELTTEAAHSLLRPDLVATLAPLPEHTTVLVNGQHKADMDDSGRLDLSFDQSGTQVVRLERWPYRTKELIFEVTRHD